MIKWTKRFLLTVVLAFALFYLFTRPADAAEAVKTFFNAFKAIGTFFTELAGPK